MVLYLYTFGLRRCADSTTPYLAVSGGLAGGCGERGNLNCELPFLSSPLAAARVWKDCCCGWLWLDLLAVSRTLCLVAVSGVMLPTVPDLAGKKKTGMERSVSTPPAFSWAGWRPALRERRRRSTCCYASPRQRTLHLSPPTSGLARSGRRRGAQLDWESLCTPLAADFGPGGGCGRGALSWTGRLLSTLPATDFGPGPKAAAEGCAAGQGFAWYASRHRLRAWLGGGGGGVRSWMEIFLGGRWRGALPGPRVCFSIFHSPASGREAHLCLVTGPDTI